VCFSMQLQLACTRVFSAFGKLVIFYEKSSVVVKTEVRTSFSKRLEQYCTCSSAVLQGIPKFYIKVLVDLEDQIKTITRGDTKKMSKTNATG